MRRGLTLAIAAGVGAALLFIVQTLLLSWVVRDVLFRHATLGDIRQLVLLTGCTMAGRALLIGVREVTAKRAAIEMKMKLRLRIAQHLIRLGPAYATGERTGDLVVTATEGIDKLDAFVSRYLPQIALSIVVPVVIVLAILPVDPLSAALLVFTVPVIVMLMVLIGTFTRDHVQSQWEALSSLSSAFLDVVQGLPTLLLLDRDGGERQRVERISGQFRDRTLSVLKVAFLSGAVLELMTAAGIGLIATVLGVRLLDSGIPFDRAFFVFLLTPEFYRPLRDLGTHRHAVIEGTAAAERIFEILETLPVDVLSDAHDSDARARTGGVPAAPLRAVSIDLQAVSYVYPDRELPALSNVTLSLEPGTCTALAGRSGSGKTTLINLLCRAIHPTEGGITMNGVPLQAIPLEVWCDQIAVVPQHPYLFRGTVRDNIRLPRPDASVSDVWHAAELAGCVSFISELPDGFETVLGERGEGLSAGQRQRLALARAFLKDAPLLMLDEPTSALDPESEGQIRESLALLMRDRTVLVVAHRFNTVRAADRVAVLDAGRVVEVGRHDELLRDHSVYSTLMIGQREVAPA